MTWRDKAACHGANPNLFDARNFYTPTDWETIEQGATTYCSACPVREDCRAEGDNYRHWGTWGAVHRRVRQGRYVWDVLVEGATEPQLTDRRTGVHKGWGLAS
jgi:hypothetical protein